MGHYYRQWKIMKKKYSKQKMILILRKKKHLTVILLLLFAIFFSLNCYFIFNLSFTANYYSFYRSSYLSKQIAKFRSSLKEDLNLSELRQIYSNFASKPVCEKLKKFYPKSFWVENSGNYGPVFDAAQNEHLRTKSFSGLSSLSKVNSGSRRKAVFFLGVTGGGHDFVKTAFSGLCSKVTFRLNFCQIII